MVKHPSIPEVPFAPVLDYKRREIMEYQSGRGAAWLARLLGVQEVPSSNLGGPTKFLKDLQLRDLLLP